MPLEKELQETGAVADTENQHKTPKRTHNADEVLPKSIKKTPSRKRENDFTPRRGVRSSTRLLNSAKVHTADAVTSTPRSQWIESEVPTSKRRAKSVYSAKPEKNEIVSSVPKSAKERSKSFSATPKKEKKLTIEMTDTATTMQKSAKLCSSTTDAQGSSHTLLTFERNETDGPESIKKRGTSLIFTPKKASTTPKITKKRCHSLTNEILALPMSTLTNVEDETNADASDNNTVKADTIPGNIVNDIIESEVVTEAHEVSGFKEKNAQRFSVVDLTDISLIDLDSPIKTDTSEIDPVVKSASITETVHAVDITPLKDIMLNENVSINNSSLISIPDTPDLCKKPLSTLNDTFSPEVSVKTTNSAEKEPTITSTTPVLATPTTRFSFRTPIIMKTPTASVKRLKSSPGKLLKREQTPFKPGLVKSGTKDVRFIVAATPEKQLLEAALPLTNLKSIRKRSLSVDCGLPKKERQRVTFHSPANMEIPIEEIDLIMESSRRDQENIRSVKAKRRQRSLSNAETAKEKARPLKELNSELERVTGTSNSKIKVPNFAAIHKRTFDRMESIDEYKNRKAERSKDMLSNQKLRPEVKGVTTTVDSTNQPVAKKNLFDACKATATKTSAVLTQTKIVKPIMAGINKLKNRQVKNKEAYKAGSSKPKVSEAVVVENKNILRGVRTNRRFDLQMKFRNNLEQD